MIGERGIRGVGAAWHEINGLLQDVTSPLSIRRADDNTLLQIQLNERKRFLIIKY